MNDEVKQALRVLERALALASEGCDAPPEVALDVSWMEVTTYGSKHREFIPTLSLKVRREVAL